MYDAGALMAADAQSRKVWTLHYACLQAGLLPIVPTLALARVFRDGARQANLSRLLKGCCELPLDGKLARRVGRLCEAASMDDDVDAVVTAVVALVATDHAAAVVTSDPGNLAHLLSHLQDDEQVEIVLV